MCDQRPRSWSIPIGILLFDTNPKVATGFTFLDLGHESKVDMPSASWIKQAERQELSAKTAFSHACAWSPMHTALSPTSTIRPSIQEMASQQVQVSLAGKSLQAIQGASTPAAPMLMG